MNNFLLLIKTSKSHVKSLSPRQLGEQVIALRNFIESQMSEGRLMIAYPLEMAGVIVSGSKGNFSEIRIDSEAELISAFYLVGAESSTRLFRSQNLIRGLTILCGMWKILCGMWKSGQY